MGFAKIGPQCVERLTDLFNEARTPHGGPYLARPPQQARTLDSRYTQLVYDLAPAGLEALKAAGDVTYYDTRPSGPWLHRHMVACVTASIELGCQARADLSFIPGHAVLARAQTALRCPIPITQRGSGDKRLQDLIPDALFGLRYHRADGNRFRFFVVECDRATEPLSSRCRTRKSWRRHLDQYRAYIGEGLYRQHLALKSPLLVLNVTTDPRRLKRMTALTQKECGACPYQLFQCWTAFGPVYRPPRPNADLLDRAWQRAGQGAFRIDQV